MRRKTELRHAGVLGRRPNLDFRALAAVWPAARLSPAIRYALCLGQDQHGKEIVTMAANGSRADLPKHWPVNGNADAH